MEGIVFELEEAFWLFEDWEVGEVVEMVLFAMGEGCG